MDTQKLQETLDIGKWLNSEKLRRDLCGEYDYCAYCENESEYPCAHAFIRMEDKLKATGVDAPEKVKAEIAATVTDKKTSVIATKRYIKSFAEKLAETKGMQKENLATLLEVFTTLGVKSRMTRKYVNLRYKRKLLAVISLNRGCLRLQLALSPEEYDIKHYPHDDYSYKKCYSKVPYSMKIQSALSVKRARQLINDAFDKAIKEINE